MITLPNYQICDRNSTIKNHRNSIDKEGFIKDSTYKKEVSQAEKKRENTLDFNDILADYENENKRYELIIKDIQDQLRKGKVNSH